MAPASLHQARPTSPKLGAAAAGLAALVSLAALGATPAHASTTTEKAQVVTVIRPLEPNGCSYTGIIRWKAVKGVSSYTVLFNDSAFTPPEQSAVISKPFADDQHDPTYPPLNAPPGSHQGVWTGSSSSGPCESYDYSERLTNARVEYERSGEFIEGTVTGPCVKRECLPTQGVRISAKGKKDNSDTTDADGNYSIKVEKGDYTVTPSQRKLEFDPKRKQVHVGMDSSVTANFRASCGGSENAHDARLARPDMKYGCCLPTSDPGFRPIPLGGAYIRADGGSDVRIHYDCTQNAVLGQVEVTRVGPLVCEDGSFVDLVRVHFIGEGDPGRTLLKSRRFVIEKSFRKPFAEVTDVEFRIVGTFTGIDEAEVRYDVSGTRISDSSHCSTSDRRITLSWQTTRPSEARPAKPARTRSGSRQTRH